MHKRDPRFNTNQLHLRREGFFTESGPKMTRISVKDSFPHYFRNKTLEGPECAVVVLFGFCFVFVFLELVGMEEILYDI